MRYWILLPAIACLAFPLSAQDLGTVVEIPNAVPAPVTSATPTTPAANGNAPEPSYGPLKAFVRPKDSKVDERGLVWRMNHYAAGERVMSVGYGEFRDEITWSDDDFKREHALIGRLQMISAKQSPKDHDLIPFKVGNSYVIAPDTREQPNLDLSGLGEFDLSSRGLLLDQVLTAIPEGQLGALGSENGIPVSSLSRDLQAAVARAFRPPLRIMNMKPSTYKDDNGLERQTTEIEDKGLISDPIDWGSTRLRARLQLMSVTVDMEPNGQGFGPQRTGLTFANVSDSGHRWQDRGVDLPLFSTVPNTYKPSDLTGKAFVQPLNYAGMWTVEQVVKQIAKITGLKMDPSVAYKNDPVFIGSNALTAGEAIDGLRLALTASWRRLGDTYILAWDRMGIQAVQLVGRESADAAAKAVKKRRRDLDSSTDWLKVADKLPFDASDPLAPTKEQRQKIFGGTSDKPWEHPEQNRIPYGEMTPSQQEWVKTNAAQNSPYLPSTPDGKPAQQRPYTDDDIRKSYFSGDCRIEYSVQVPGFGWVKAADDWESQNLGPYTIASARRKLSENSGGAKRNILDEAPPEMREIIEHPKPVVPPSDVRALMVPPLSAARLKVLADEMKRHGLNTLFYPVLYGGYATFESKAFPLHPSLRGTDGWAAATAAMAPAGVKVIGYFHTLAWQDAGDKVHYLSKHPDWIDVDVAGRPRAPWFEAHPDVLLKAASIGILTSNYVRPLEPTVSLKLQLLVDEFAKKPGAAGICFTEWQPSDLGSSGPFTSLTTPALGYALPDRLAAYRRTGQDPVDLLSSWDDFVPPSLAEKRWELMGSQQRDKPGTPDPHITMVLDLLKRAKADRKDWKTWVQGPLAAPFNPSSAQIDIQKSCDEVLGGIFGAMGGGATRQGAVLPITSQNLIATLAADEIPAGEEVPDSVLKMPSIVIFSMFFVEMRTQRNGGQTTFPSIVYDFRTAPEEITPSLQWIQAPDKAIAMPPKATTTPPKPGAKPK